MKTIDKIKRRMVDALEEPVREKGIVMISGKYICHHDIPEDTPAGFDTHFTVVGYSQNKCWLVCIQEIELSRNRALMKSEQDELDDLKGIVHKEFDWLWQSGRMSRRTAYVWMQLKLGLKPSKAHIKLLSKDQLSRLLDEVREYKKGLDNTI